MSYDFVMGQLRLALISFLAFATGKGWLTPTDAGNITAIASPLALIAFPVIWSWTANWRKKYVPSDSIAIDGATPHAKLGNGAIQLADPKAVARVVGCLIALLLAISPALAADLPPVAPGIASANLKSPKATVTCVSGDCSGFYADFGLGWDAALASTITGGANNGAGLSFGVGYQLWRGQVIAGVEIDGGYQFGTAGATGTATSTQFVKLGYNFFPSLASAPANPSQNPFLNIVPANLLANSTPSIIAGGCYGHGIEKACAGLEIDTVIAAGWSTAFQLYNAPAMKGQSDENVFRVMVQKHF